MQSLSNPLDVKLILGLEKKIGKVILKTGFPPAKTAMKKKEEEFLGSIFHR